MTVGELRAALAAFPDDMQVVYGYDGHYSNPHLAGVIAWKMPDWEPGDPIDSVKYNREEPGWEQIRVLSLTGEERL